MTYSNDLIDSLLFAASHKGVPVLQSTTTKASAGPITYDQVRAGYNAAMKSDSNPYSTATGTKIQQQSARSSLDLVILREILPSCINDTPGADEFDNWVFEGFRNGMRDALGSVRAQHRTTKTFYRQSFTINRDLLDRALGESNANLMDSLLVVIDDALLKAVQDIVSMTLPPHDITTCTDPECFC